MPFPADLLAGDEDRLSDQDRLPEAALHLACIGGDTALQEEIIPHHLIHQCHDEAAMHAVIVALMLA